MHMVVCVHVHVFWQQGWCLSGHVRGRWLLLWHLHRHLVSRQDVLKEKGKKTKHHLTVEKQTFHIKQ